MQTTTATRHPTAAEIIQSQIGGLAFRMLGAHSFTTDAKGFSLRFAIKGSRKVNTVIVTLDGSDTYTIEFWKIAPRTCKRVSAASNVYCDSLRTVIETHTGLYTSL
jgi:hypothetical protein